VAQKLAELNCSSQFSSVDLYSPL